MNTFTVVFWRTNERGMQPGVQYPDVAGPILDRRGRRLEHKADIYLDEGDIFELAERFEVWPRPKEDGGWELRMDVIGYRWGMR